MTFLVPRNVATIALIAVALVSALLSSPAFADERAAETEFYELINDLRRTVGVEPLAVHPELEAEALRWTEQVATEGAIRHDGDLSVGVSERWNLLGENVGTTDKTVRVLFDAFVASPTHYENLVEPTFDTIGLAVVEVADGRIYTVQRFMDVAGEARVAPATFPVTATTTVTAREDDDPFDPSTLVRVVDELDRAGI